MDALRCFTESILFRFEPESLTQTVVGDPMACLVFTGGKTSRIQVARYFCDIHGLIETTMKKLAVCPDEVAGPVMRALGFDRAGSANMGHFPKEWAAIFSEKSHTHWTRIWSPMLEMYLAVELADRGIVIGKGARPWADAWKEIDEALRPSLRKYRAVAMVHKS